MCGGWMPSTLFLSIGRAIGCFPLRQNLTLRPAVQSICRSASPGGEVLYPLVQVMKCNGESPNRSTYFFCRLNPIIAPIDATILPDGT